MGFELEFDDEDRPGLSETCVPTSIVNVFTDNIKNEVIIVVDGKSIIIKL